VIARSSSKQETSPPNQMETPSKSPCPKVPKSKSQGVLNMYVKELPAMNYAANTGKESMFLKRCVSNGISIVVPETLLSLTGAVIASTSPSLISKYCTLLLVSESEESTGEVISAITYQIISADTQYAEIPLAAVSSIHQHKGIGCLMYSELRKRLQNVGICTIFCWGDAESNIFWLKQGFVPVGEVNTKGRAQRLPIKANVRKALCFPGGSTLLVSHINKGSEVNPLQPVKLSIPNKGPGRGKGAEVDPSIRENLTTFGKENSQPEELMKGCCKLIPLDGGDGEMANDLGLSQMEADGDVKHCTCSALCAKKRIWEASHTSLKSKKVKGGHQIDCQFGYGNASRSDRTHDYCLDGSTLDTSRNISLLDITSTNPMANNHLEKDVLEDRNCLRVMMMNISDDAKKSSLTKNIYQFMNLSLAIYLAGVLVVTAIQSSMIIEDLGGTVASDGNEMPFILEDEDYKLKYRIDLKDAMLRAKASPQALLKGYDVCLAAHVHPTVSTLSAIVRSAGGNARVLLPTSSLSVIYVSGKSRKWRNGLFTPEEIIRINHSLHFSQPLKVVLEIVNTPNTCFLIACLALTVYSQVIIPIVEIMNMFPALCGYGVSDSGVSAILPPQGVQCIAPDSGPISKKTFHNPSIPSTEIGFST
ncbi:hypothetical protein RJ640_001133, partial [Escallonia rubra]